jgi:DNA-binding transcriptional LysR family regulator
MELRSLRYFASVVEAGSLTAAAARLHVSQPSLSVAMARLETEVGVRLLTRTARGVEPTSAGRYLLDAATRVLGEVDELVPALRRFGSGVAGSLTLAAVPVLMWHRVPKLLRAHAVEAPEVEVRLIDPPPWTAIDMLEQRTADLAAIVVSDAARFIRRHRDALRIVDWGEVPLVAVLPPEERAAPSPFPLAGFEGRTLLLPRRTAAVPSLPEAVDETLRRHGVAPGEVRTVETIQTILPLIEAGAGCAILPDPDGVSLTRFDVVVRGLEPPPRPLRALVLARAGEAAEPALARLLRQLAPLTSTDHV